MQKHLISTGFLFVSFVFACTVSFGGVSYV